MTFIPEQVKSDEEYMSYISDLVGNEKLQQLNEITHHYHTTRLKHSYYVSYTSYKIAKALDLNAKETARAGLLHDFFLESNEEIEALGIGSQAAAHPKIAVENAGKLTPLSDLEKDIIVSHMFLTCAKSPVPKYKESFIVTMMDKYCAVNEFFTPVKSWVAGRVYQLQHAVVFQNIV